MIQAHPIGRFQLDKEFETNIVSLDYRGPSLFVSIEASDNKTYQIQFDQQIAAFRYMEEGDLTYYWDSGSFDESYLLYEITSGGWLSKERSNVDVLGIARSGNWLREWFIPTRNHSIFVLSNTEPKVSELPNA